MIASKESFVPHSGDQLPNSRRVYVAGTIYKTIRVPMREITLETTRSSYGRIEVNEPVRVYDCSGPWGDPDFKSSVAEGLPLLRREWILKRGDVEECDGREVNPRDNGYLSEAHQEYSAKRTKTSNFELQTSNLPKRRPLRASAGRPVTQLWYARQGIITPEMEFIAVRENQGLELLRQKFSAQEARNSLFQQHRGSSSPHHPTAQSIFTRFPQRIPNVITPEFVRDEVAAS